ncbi:MAG: ADP-ribose pyrophosphatase, partial [archaeon]|nr:ADP-ribose pyrophosphatase [archaeon]
GELKKPSFTEKEKSHGFQLMWVHLDEAINILRNDNPDDMTGKFIQHRDLEFLSRVQKIKDQV